MNVRFLPPLPRPVREVRPVARLYDDRMAIMLWLAEHSLEANDVAYLIEMSDGRYAAKLYERDAEGKFFLRLGEAAHRWHCFRPKSPCPI